MITSIINILGGVFSSIGTWMKGYGNSKTTEARVVNEEIKKEDKFHEDLKNRDIDSVRRGLSS